MIIETEEEKNARVAAVIGERLTVELSLPFYDGKTQAEGFAFLHATTFTAAVTQPKTLTVTGLLGGLSSGSKARLRDWNDASKLKDAILAQDRLAVGIYLDLLVSGDELTPALIESSEAAVVYAELIATETVQVTTQIQPRVATEFGGVEGFPNVVDSEIFAAAWAAAGRAV